MGYLPQGLRTGEREMLKKSYICDRCSKEVSTRPLRILIQMYGKLPGNYNAYRTEDRFDLCPECAKELATFLNEKKGSKR